MGLRKLEGPDSFRSVIGGVEPESDARATFN